MSVRRLLNTGTLASIPWICDFATRFIRTIILARLLSPAEFGIAIAINVMLAIAYMISDLGIDKFLISRASGNEDEELATAHALHLIRGVIVAGVVFLGAPACAWAFGAPGSAAGFRWIALILFIHGFAHLRVKQVEREFRYLPTINATVISSVASLVVVYPAVRIFQDHRAMVVSLLVSSVLYNGLSHLLSDKGYRISLREPRLVREALAYGLPLTVNGVGLAASSQLDRTVVGHWLGLAQLALFTVVLNLASAPVSLGISVLSTLGLPFLVQSRERHLQAQGYLTVLWTFSVIASSASVFFAGTLSFLVPLVFGGEYTVHSVTQILVSVLVWIRLVRGAPSLMLLVVSDTARLMYANLISGSGLLLAALLLPFYPNLDIAIGCTALGEAVSLVFLLDAGARHVNSVRSSQLGEVLRSLAPGIAGIAAAAVGLSGHNPASLLLLGIAAALILLQVLSGIRRYFVQFGMLALFNSNS